MIFTPVKILEAGSKILYILKKLNLVLVLWFIVNLKCWICLICSIMSKFNIFIAFYEG